MKVKYPGIIVGIVLAAMLFVGAGTAGDISDSKPVSMPLPISAQDAPSNNSGAMMIADKQPDTKDGARADIFIAVKQIFDNNPVVWIVKKYAEHQTDALQKILSTEWGCTVAGRCSC